MQFWNYIQFHSNFSCIEMKHLSKSNPSSVVFQKFVVNSPPLTFAHMEQLQELLNIVLVLNSHSQLFPPYRRAQARGYKFGNLVQLAKFAGRQGDGWLTVGYVVISRIIFAFLDNILNINTKLLDHMVFRIKHSKRRSIFYLTKKAII